MKLTRACVLLLVPLVLQQCMLSGKMTRIVSEHYAPKAKLRIQETPNWLEVKTDNLPRINGYCQVNYNRFFTVPLIVYFYSDEKIQCSVNPKIYVNRLIDELTRSLTTNGIESKISGKKIEITVTSLPLTFHHRYYSHYAALQLLFNNLYFSISENELSNKAGSLAVDYVIRDNSAQNIIKAGSLSAGIPGSFVTKNYSQRRKFFVQDYISTFDMNVETSVKQICTDLINQL
jgi:hypothetical protein